MDIFSILIIALGLAMDAFAVSIASGAGLRKCELKTVLRIALFFGTFQGIMPVIGWAASQHFKGYVAGIDHWIAFALLVGVGIKMIYESQKIRADEPEICAISNATLFILAIATSIDALAVGLSISFIDVAIAGPALLIGGVTFILSTAGVYIGDRIGHCFEGKIEILGGILLIGIGAKILLEHLLA